jgi:peptidyl-prolyl cis-trans isomerase C
MNHKLSVVVVAVLAVWMVGCAEKSSAPAMAVAVKVNGSPISVAELDSKMKQYSHFPEEQKASVANTLLKATIDAEMLAQAALAEKLDADAVVSLKLVQAKRMILANAYVEKRRGDVAKPTEADVKAYYDGHPELFAERKIYELTELVIQPKPANEAELLAKLGDGKHFDEFSAWLVANKIPHGSRPHTAAPDNMPDDIVAKLKTLAVGQATAISGDGQLSILRVNGLQLQPMTLEQATAAIEKKLLDERMKQAMDDALKSLRDKVKIEYIPPYSADAAEALKK